MVAIRPGRPGDRDLFWRATMETVWRDIPDAEKAGLSTKDFEEHFRERVTPIVDYEGSEFLVAEEGGRVAGYLLLGAIGSFYSPETHAFVYDIWVDEAFRRKGVGRALLEAAFERARERGFRKIKLEVSAANARAREIYAQAGFQEERVILGRPLD